MAQLGVFFLALSECELRTNMAQLGVSLALTVCELRTSLAQLGMSLPLTVCKLRATNVQLVYFSSDCQ